MSARARIGLGTFVAGLLVVATMLATGASPAAREAFTPAGRSLGAAIENPRAWPRCPQCGVIESVREVAPDEGSDALPRRYEVTIRFRDGTTTMFDAAKPRAWRLGSRVNVIGGAEVMAP